MAYLDLNNPEFFELSLGSSKIGATVAPLNFRLTPDELGRIVADSEATVLVVGAVFAPMLAAIRAAAPALHTVLTVGAEYESWVTAASDTDPGRASRPETSSSSSTRRAPPGCPRA